jgi:hypothetical protein
VFEALRIVFERPAVDIFFWVFRTSSGSLEGVGGGHVAGGRPESS